MGMIWVPYLSKKLRTLSKDVKKWMKKKKKWSKVEVSAWRINYLLDVSNGRVQRSMAIIVTSRMKNPPKKLEFSVFA